LQTLETDIKFVNIYRLVEPIFWILCISALEPTSP